MFKKNFLIIFIFLTSVTTSSFCKEKVFIELNIDQDIITNIDIKKEVDYLKILNPKLSNLEKQKIYEIAKVRSAQYPNKQ